MRKMICKKIMVIILAVFSTVALFADVESTGNLSMALNGDGIPQLIAVVLLAYGYEKVLIKNDMICCRQLRERVGYGILACLFALFMIIGKAQNAEPDLKYYYFAILLFIGYTPLFWVILSWIGHKLDHMEKTTILSKAVRWLFEDHVIAGVMLSVFLFRLPYLIAFFPCSMSWDGGAQICDFYGLFDKTAIFSDHHPPMVSYLYGSVAYFSQQWGIPNLGMFVIPLGQTCLSAFAVAKVCLLEKKLKTPYGIRWATLAYFVLFTVWNIFDVTYIKDSIYWQLSLLFAVETASCIVDQEAFWSRRKNLFLLFLYGVLMTQTRNNGIFVLLFTLPALFIIVKRDKKILFGGAAAAAFIMIYFINNMLYPALGVVNIEVKEDTYCIMFQQTAKYGQDYPEDVTDEEREFLNRMFDYEELVTVYNPQLADWVKNCLKICEATSADGTNAEFAAVKKEYFCVWFNQLKRHPLSYINTFLECSYGYYYPEVKPYKEGMGFYEMDRNMFTQGMHDARQIQAFAPARFFLEQISKIQYLPGIGLLYRCGFYTWCVLFAVDYLLVRKRYREVVIAIPAIVNILVCLISPVNTCIRYAMPTMCLIPLLYAVICREDSIS